MRVWCLFDCLLLLIGFLSGLSFFYFLGGAPWADGPGDTCPLCPLENSALKTCMHAWNMQTSITWIPCKLVILSRFITWKNKFSDISRKCILPNMIRKGLLANCMHLVENVHYHIPTRAHAHSLHSTERPASAVSVLIGCSIFRTGEAPA